MPVRKTKNRDVGIEVEVEKIADGVVVRPIGSIDMTRSPMLQMHLLEAAQDQPGRVVLDLSQVPEIDSSVVATLVEVLRVICRDSGMLVLCGLQERVVSILQIVRLDHSVFPIVDTVDDAIALPNRRKFGRYIASSLNCDRGEILDISAGGLKLKSTKRISGTVRLRLWNEQTDLSIEAQVIRCQRVATRHFESGLQFVGLGAESAKKLAGILATVREKITRNPRAPRAAA